MLPGSMSNGRVRYLLYSAPGTGDDLIRSVGWILNLEYIQPVKLYMFPQPVLSFPILA